MNTPKIAEPIIKHDTDLGWELFVPQHLLPIELRTVSVSPAGLYIETIDNSWDLIPFEDMRDLLDEGSRSLDENIDIDPIDRNRSIIASLTCPVIVAAGQPAAHHDSMPTGQERAYRRWEADQRYEFTYPGGDD